MISNLQTNLLPPGAPPGSVPRMVRPNDDYIPTDWTAQCEAKCRKTGKQCPHRCTSQIPNTIAGHPVMDEKYFWVSGREARLCSSHNLSWWARAKRLLTLPLIDGGHLSPYNKHGYGSVIIKQDRIDFDNPKIKIPKAWGVMRWRGNVPAGLLERLPHWPNDESSNRPSK